MIATEKFMSKFVCYQKLPHGTLLYWHSITTEKYGSSHLVSENVSAGQAQLMTPNRHLSKEA